MDIQIIEKQRIREWGKEGGERGNRKEREMAPSLSLPMPDCTCVDPYDKLPHTEIARGDSVLVTLLTQPAPDPLVERDVSTKPALHGIHFSCLNLNFYLYKVRDMNLPSLLLYFTSSYCMSP